MRAIWFLVAAALLAGCVGGDSPDLTQDPASNPSATATMAQSPPHSRPTFEAVEVYNKSHALQPAASPAPDRFDVPEDASNLTVTVRPVTTQPCGLHVEEVDPSGDPAFVDSGVLLTAPDGNRTLVPYDTRSGCSPQAGVERQPSEARLAALPGPWSVQVRGRGVGIDIGVAIVAS